MKKTNHSLFAFSCVVAIYFIFSLIIIINNGLPNDYNSYGTLGDSFGILNSLFSGLGFAGLVINILTQQRQIKSQEKETNDQEHRYQINHYENTLHRLIEIYKSVLGEVYIDTPDGVYRSRDALQKSVKLVMESIREGTVDNYPLTLRKKIRKKKLTESEKSIIEYVQYQHFVIIRANLKWQGRLIQTFDILMKHVEKNCPNNYDINISRELVMSQLTTVECQYWFLFCLSNRKYVDLVEALSSSVFLQKNRKISMLQVHRDMFEKYWEVDLSEGYQNYPPIYDPIEEKAIKGKQKNMKEELLKIIEAEERKHKKRNIAYTEKLKLQVEVSALVESE